MKSKSDAVVEAPQGSDTAYNISFWRVLLLCIPALILGAALRASFLAVTPEVYYQTDTYFRIDFKGTAGTLQSLATQQ